jgi:hypothetical protein
LKTKFSRIQSQKILAAIGSHVDKEIGKKDKAATEAYFVRWIAEAK